MRALLANERFFWATGGFALSRRGVARAQGVSRREKRKASGMASVALGVRSPAFEKAGAVRLGRPVRGVP
jgi:hypothetical protein